MHQTQPNRRAFLASMTALAAAGSMANASDEEPQVTVAVIGAGGRGSDLIRALSTIDSARIVGVCDDYAPHLEQGVKFAGPQAASFSDYRKMLSDLKPQAVVVAVPLHLHYQVGSDCLAAGSDLFLEKTMCRTLDEGRRLAQQVRESKRVFQIGLQRRANPIYKQAQAMVDAGMIGQITAVKAQWHRNHSWRRPIPAPKTDPRWQSLERRLNWRMYRDSSGGLMTELGSHQMDVANWLLGGVPKRVMASGGIDHYRDGREVLDNIFCIYEYEVKPASKTSQTPAYNVRVTYSSVCNNAYEGAAELILGTKGSLYLTSSKGLLFAEQGAIKTLDVAKDLSAVDAAAAAVTAGKTLKLSNDPWAHRGQPVEIDIGEGNDTRDELLAFLGNVQRKDPNTIADVEVALHDCATVLLANDAVEAGRWVDFPADLQTLVGKPA